MRPSSRKASQNRLLTSLPAADLGLLRPNLEPLALAVRYVLEKPSKRIDDVYFIDSGFASVVAIQGKQVNAEVGLIGREGMTGLPVVLGDHLSVQSTYIQAPGSGHRIDAIVLRKAMNNSPSLRASLLRYVHAFMIQTTHTAVANACAKLVTLNALPVAD
jgi:hypothetical protein